MNCFAQASVARAHPTTLFRLLPVTAVAASASAASRYCCGMSVLVTVVYVFVSKLMPRTGGLSDTNLVAGWV